MDRDTIIRLAREAKVKPLLYDGKWAVEGLDAFAALIEDHLKEQGYRQCAKGQKTTQYCGMVEQAVQAEREACAKVCEEDGLLWGQRYAAAIRSRK